MQGLTRASLALALLLAAHAVRAQCPDISITPTAVPDGVVGSAYPNTPFNAAGAAAPITFTDTGSLPSGMSLDGAGLLSGTPGGAGTFVVRVLVTDANGCNASQILPLNVALFAGPRLVINEVEYDEPGLDNAEFVEIFNAGNAPASLTNLAFVLMNGANNLEYGRTNLSGTLAAGGFVVICPQGAAPGTCAAGVAVVPGTSIFNFSIATNIMQNGAPDGVGLVNLAANTMIDALSYEGSITAGMVTGVGTFNFVEGNPVLVADDGTFVDSLQRFPNGADTDDAATNWVRRLPSPGAPTP